MSYRVLITDDEPLARERIKRFLEHEQDFETAGEASDGTAALAWLKDNRADIVLLDIHMPGPDGLAIAREISTLPKPPAVVFCTAYDDHAIDAFRVDAVDYLLKPIRREDLHTALRRAVARLRQLRTASPDCRTHLSSRTHSGIRRIAVDDILWFSADQKYVTAHCSDGEFLLDETLKQLEEEFSSRFIRTHRSILVATSAIDQLHTGLQSSTLSLTGSETHLPVSRRHLSGVRRFIKGG